MSFKPRSVAVVIASAGYAHAALGGDEKALHLMVAEAPPSGWSRPLVFTATPAALRSAPSLGGFLPSFSASFAGTADQSSRLLFLSPLSPLRAALRVAAQDLAAQTLSALEPALENAATSTSAPSGEATVSPDQAARRREVILRQRRKSVLNDRAKSGDHTALASARDAGYEVGNLSGDVELRAIPAGSQAVAGDPNTLRSGSGVVRVSGAISDDLSFAVTGLAAESAATTFRAGAEFELQAGDLHRFEIGAVYGTRFKTANDGLKQELDQRSVGAFRVVHSMNVLENVSTRIGGRFVDAPFLKSSRAFDPEFSVLIEDGASNADASRESTGRSYLRLDVSGDTLFPGLDVVNGDGDMIALTEGLPVFATDLRAQRTWNRALAAGYRGHGARFEGRIQDQTVANALLVFPSSLSGAPLVENGRRGRVQIGTLLVEHTFAGGQAQAGVEYGYGRFDGSTAGARDFHQLTTRLDGMLRRTGTGIAVFHRLHEGAGVSDRGGGSHGANSPGSGRAQRYLIELRQDVPFVPSMIGADMALLVSLRNVYYDDIDRRSVDEFAVASPPRRITGGIRVKF